MARKEFLNVRNASFRSRPPCNVWNGPGDACTLSQLTRTPRNLGAAQGLSQVQHLVQRPMRLATVDGVLRLEIDGMSELVASFKSGTNGPQERSAALGRLIACCDVVLAVVGFLSRRDHRLQRGLRPPHAHDRAALARDRCRPIHSSAAVDACMRGLVRNM